MGQAADLDISVDFATVTRNAERVRAMLIDLRQRFDLAPFEYCRQVRIAPGEIPYSHPQITLNSFVQGELALLSTYLHEQMHWYVTWYSHTQASSWQRLFTSLRERYPQVPDAESGGAPDEFSTYLHFPVNWIEIETVSRFFERDHVLEYVNALPFYRWIYKTVVADWDRLGALFIEQGLIPIRPATEMSAHDLELAARVAEAAT